MKRDTGREAGREREREREREGGREKQCNNRSWNKMNANAQNKEIY